MRCVIKGLIVATAIAVISAPAVARADGFVSPWVSANGGSGFNNFDNGRVGFGVNAGAMGKGIIGGEVDFGWSPSFFGTQNDFGNNSVMDLMGNVILGIPIGGQHGGGVRPFVSGGVGLLRTQIDGGSLTTFDVPVEQHSRLESRRRRDGLFQRSHRAARRPQVSAQL